MELSNLLNKFNVNPEVNEVIKDYLKNNYVLKDEYINATNELKELKDKIQAEEQQKEKELKTSLLDNLLNEEGFTNEKLRKLISKTVKLEDLTIEDNKLQGIDIKELSEEYKDYKTTITTNGHNPMVSTGQAIKMDTFLQGLNNNKGVI